jgi:hypothetical protein
MRRLCSQEQAPPHPEATLLRCRQGSDWAGSHFVIALLTHFPILHVTRHLLSTRVAFLGFSSLIINPLAHHHMGFNLHYLGMSIDILADLM